MRKRSVQKNLEAPSSNGNCALSFSSLLFGDWCVLAQYTVTTVQVAVLSLSLSLSLSFLVAVVFSVNGPPHTVSE